MPEESKFRAVIDKQQRGGEKNYDDDDFPQPDFRNREVYFRLFSVNQISPVIKMTNTMFLNYSITSRDVRKK